MTTARARGQFLPEILELLLVQSPFEERRA